MRNILFRPRDKQGNVRIRPKGDIGQREMSFAQAMRVHWASLGVSGWKIEDMLAEQAAKQKALVDSLRERQVASKRKVDRG